MTILIKGIEMPEICFMCPVYDGGYGCCKITHQECLREPDWCPLDWAERWLEAEEG